MACRPKPWYRNGRGWFVQVAGKQHNLGPDKELAFQRFYELMRETKSRPIASTESLAVTCDEFLAWTARHRAKRTYEWYRERLEWFLSTVPTDMTPSQLKPYHVQRWLDVHPTWSHGHRRGCIVAVQRALRWATKMGYIDSSPIAHIEKPTAGTRDLIITRDSLDDILAHVHDRDFRNTKGKPWNGYSVNCRFERLKKKLGTKYCLYAFRHSLATRMLENGLDALTVAILLGHRNPAMLSSTYQHLAHNPRFLLEQVRRTSA